MSEQPSIWRNVDRPGLRVGRPSVEERFWRRVRKTDGCWTWTGALSTLGYGRMWTNRNGTPAHRYSWEIHNGPIPAGMDVLHRCDNRACVRPDHLWLGTHDENMADMLSSPPSASATDTRVEGKPDQRQSRPSAAEGHPTRGPGARASHRPASSLPGAGRNS